MLLWSQDDRIMIRSGEVREGEFWLLDGNIYKNQFEVNNEN